MDDLFSIVEKYGNIRMAIVKLFRKYSVEIFLFTGGIVGFVYMMLNCIYSTAEQTRWGFDLYFRNTFSSIITDNLTQIETIISNLGSGYFYTLCMILIYAYFIWNKWTIKLPTYFLANLLVAYGIGTIAKKIFHRSRPSIENFVEASGYSFPSLHAMNSTAVAILFSFFIYAIVENRYYKWTIIMLSLMFMFSISFSRIYLGVHYESDVIAGIFAGMVVASVFSFILKFNGLLDSSNFARRSFVKSQ